MKQEKIRWRIIIPLTVTFLLTFSGVLVGFYQHLRGHVDDEVRTRLEDVSQIYAEQIGTDAEMIRVTIESMQQDPCLRSAWLARSRTRLLDCARPRFEYIRDHHLATRFYFHDLQRINFLRVHDPDHYGDFRGSFTLADAVRNGQSEHGIELDAQGIPTLRIVYPWKIDGKLVGYIEIGIEVARMLKTLKGLLGDVEILLILDKEYLAKEDWERSGETPGKEAGWDVFPGHVLADATMDIAPDQLRSGLKDTLVPGENSTFELSLKGRTFAGSYLSLTDYIGRNIGSIGVLSDISEELRDIRLFYIALVIGTAGITFMLATFFWIYFGRVEQNLSSAKKKLEREVEEHQEAEVLLRRNEERLEQEIQLRNMIAAEEKALSELLRLAIREIPMQDFLRQSLEVILDSVSWKGLQPKGAIFLNEERGHGQSLQLQIDHDMVPELNNLCARIPFGKCLCGRAAASREIQFSDVADKRREIHFPELEAHCHYNIPILFEETVLGVLAIFLPAHYGRVPREEEFLQRVADILSMGISKRYSDEAMLSARIGAEEASRAKSRFLATMSHEIRTPMNGVLGMTELLKDTQLTFEQQEYVDTIHQSGRSLLAIINDILDFSKVEAGRLELTPIPFDLERSIHDVGQLLLPKAEEKGLELILDFGSDCSQRLVGDAGRLRQILMNLVGNAIKFTEQGHILLQVRCRPVSNKDAVVEVTVEDTGIGISEQERSLLFESFFQADGSTTRQHGGTGLGLAISRQLVELMGGEIGVDSTPGKGSRFWFNLRLPLGSKPEPLPFASLAGVQILVVDDNVMNLRVLEEQLKAVAMKVEAVADGRQAIELMQQRAESEYPFQLVLFDFDMPERDGEEMARTIRADVRFDGVPLVLLTSFGKKGDAVRFKEAGFSAYLSKPVLSTVLYQTLSSVLGLKDRGEDAPIVTRHTIEEVVSNETDSSIGFRGRVLLVEDVPANQKVAAVMLQRLGIKVDVAKNGKEALDRWERSDYDLILMDCQMPVMDGYDATQAIRSRTDRGRVPIVALTANALESDRKRCIEAGMDGFIAKPFERNDLIKVLEQWLPIESFAGTRIESISRKWGEKQASASNYEEPIDRAQMESMRNALGEDFDDLVDTYLEGVEDMLRAIPLAWERSDLEELERQAHSIKSSSASVGAVVLSKLARSLEEQARAGGLDGVSEQVRQMEMEFERVRDGLAS